VKKSYYRHGVSGVTLELSHTRKVEWKTISVGRITARYVIGNPHSKKTDKTDKQTSRKFDTSNS